MEEIKYTLADLTPEEADALTKDLQKVLIRHNAELGVKSSIEILKRVEIKNEDGIPSSFTPDEESDTKKETPETD